MHKSKTKELKQSNPTYHPSQWPPWENLCLSVCFILSWAGLEALVLKRGTSCKGYSKGAIELQPMTVTWSFCIQRLAGKKRSHPGRVNQPWSAGRGRNAFTWWGQGRRCVELDDSLGYFLVLPCSVVIINGQVNNPLPVKDLITRDSEISGVEVWWHQK